MSRIITSIGITGYKVLKHTAKGDSLEIDLQALSKRPPACTLTAPFISGTVAEIVKFSIALVVGRPELNAAPVVFNQTLKIQFHPLCSTDCVAGDAVHAVRFRSKSVEHQLRRSAV